MNIKFMKTSTSIILIHLLLLTVTIFISCNKKEVPVVSTTEITEITGTTAKGGGAITDEGSGTVIARGVCWSKGITPTLDENKTADGAGAGSFISSLTGLIPETKYYVRAYATNSVGTGYGMAMSFTTIYPLYDIDGNGYDIIKIGTQTWMTENLRTTKYSDGSQITNIISGTSWASQSSEAYCWYNNEESLYKNDYGALYNWYAVSSGKLCPTGWHVPSNSEWNTLDSFLGGISSVGPKIKETGSEHWSASNVTTTNESSFTALPGGYRNFNGNFYGIFNSASWWTSTEKDSQTAYLRDLYLDNSYKIGTYPKNVGYSVRCIKD